MKNFCEDLFFFFWRALALCVLGPWPWPRAFLSLASRVPVLGKAVLGLGLGLGFFLCPWPWPWPRALCPRLHLCQGQPYRGQTLSRPRTQAQVLSEKKKGLLKNFSSDLHYKTFSKKFFKHSTKFYHSKK